MSVPSRPSQNIGPIIGGVIAAVVAMVLLAVLGLYACTFSDAEGAPKSRGLEHGRSWSSRTMPRHRPNIILQVHSICPLHRYLSRALLHTLRCDQSILLQIFTDCSRLKARTADLKLLKLLCPGDHRLKPIWCFALWNEPNACSVQFHHIFHYFRKLAGESIGSRPVLCTRGPSKPAG